MDTRELKRGMKVFASDGHNLGKITEIGEQTFIIEKGFFFPKEYVCRHDQIADLRGDEIWLSQNAMALRETEGDATATPVESQHVESQELESEEEVRVPLAEEQLEARTYEREAGEVRVTKGVVTEERSISVPLRKEEVHVERVPASGAATEAGAEAKFEEGEVRVPIREEVATIEKNPVVREEVRVSKTAHEDEETLRAKTRKETAEIEKDGKARRVDEEHRNP